MQTLDDKTDLELLEMARDNYTFYQNDGQEAEDGFAALNILIAREKARQQEGHWIPLVDAPLQEHGLLWAEGLPFPDQGSVYQYADGGRFATGSSKGFEFTHWRRINPPQSPTQQEQGE